MEKEYRPGDSNRITRKYLDSLLIETRYIDSVLPDTRLHMYGESFATPIMTAAFSHLDRFRENGMVEMAKGAKAAGAVMWSGWGNDEELESMAATGAKIIKIEKPFANNDEIYRRMAHAEACGCIAFGIDTDHSFTNTGKYDELRGHKMSGKTLDEIKGFINVAKLPFIIKGVLGVQEALKCLEAGVSGIVVSHHAGKLDFAVPPLMALPKIVEAVGGKIRIFVDCGIYSGYDAFKALALGADAVCFGRAILKPLSENGAEGVEAALNEATALLAGIMARTGSPDITRIDRSVIHNAPCIF